MIEIKSIPAFNDNYIWLIQINQHCIVVDPGDAQPVLKYLQDHDLTLKAILITHHHADHTGGIVELTREYPNISVIGPKNDPVMGLSLSVDEGDKFTLLDQEFNVLSLAGHTKGHIGYTTENALFCGDVLFSAGCGRVFEGSYEEMFGALNKLAALDDTTQVYCAHEYTAANVAFAMAVEPENKELHQYRDTVNRLRANNQATIPTTIGQEKQINPFLRTQEPSVIKAVANTSPQCDPLAIFSALRDWKNQF
ncbi:hydroxyacylglutathione hydrolase [Vibrio sp. RC27]